MPLVRGTNLLRRRSARSFAPSHTSQTSRVSSNVAPAHASKASGVLSRAAAAAVEALEQRVLLTVALADGGFQTPALAAGVYQQQPAGSPWVFTDSAGVSSDGSFYTSANPAPSGGQVAYL